jgi:hypothetical protein
MVSGRRAMQSGAVTAPARTDDDVESKEECSAAEFCENSSCSSLIHTLAAEPWKNVQVVIVFSPTIHAAPFRVLLHSFVAC